MKRVVIGLLAFSVSACSVRGTLPEADLAVRLDCLREQNLAVVAAHRGQPDPSAAENALSSLRASLAGGVPVLEIDVATTSDGVLVLMHDDTLDRTTTGTGPVRERTWAEVAAVRIKRPDGTLTEDRVPTLAGVLAWGRRFGAHFELDVKRTTRFADVVTAVRTARMRDKVVIITYTLEDAKTVHALDPGLMLSVTLDTPEAIAAARAAINSHRMLGWSGTRDPQTKPFDDLRAAGIEPIFGTLGRAGQRLDDVYAADGNLSEYRDLVRAGVVMIASDAAVAAQREIGMGYRACWGR